jgi:hypothetical protein
MSIKGNGSMKNLKEISYKLVFLFDYLGLDHVDIVDFQRMIFSNVSVRILGSFAGVGQRNTGTREYRLYSCLVRDSNPLS